MTADFSLKRCAWVPLNDSLYVKYHDEEWGVPIHNDNQLFEFLTLEGFQAGLSWRTLLYKRDNFRLAFDGFDPSIIAFYNENKIAELLANQGIIRNRNKIQSCVTNAKAFLRVQEEFGSFDNFVWQFVGKKSLHNGWNGPEQIPNTTAVSEALSLQLKERGFRYVGSTICYAFMQATGIVNDHTRDCFRFRELSSI